MRGATRTTLGAASASVLFGLPLFLTGTLAVLMREDLGFDEAQLGTSFTLFFLVGAAVSVVGGAVSERLGPRRTMLLGGFGTVVALVAIATVVDSYTGFLACLLLAGLTNGLAQPATNLAIAVGVPPPRHGVAFGLKQSAGPATTLIAGFALPLVLHVGWRAAFAGSAVLWVLVALMLPTIPARSVQRCTATRLPRATDVPMPTLVLLAMGAVFAMAAAASLSAFLVSAVVVGGMEVGRAGLLFAGGSVASILVRVISGWLADRRDGRHLLIVAVMLLLGGLGYALLAFGSTTIAVVAGTILAFGVGWGWTGLHNFAVVRGNPSAPGVATSVTQTGLLLGGVVGPAVFGLVVVRAGYPAAWLGAAVCALVAALLTLLGRNRIQHHRRSTLSLT